MKKQELINIKDFLKDQGCSEECMKAILDITRNIQDDLQQLQMRPEWKAQSLENRQKCLKAIVDFFRENIDKFI